MEIIEFSKSTRSYTTREKAVQAAQKQIEAYLPAEVHNDIRVVIQAQYGRFSPCFILRQGAMHLAASIAGHGWQVIG